MYAQAVQSVRPVESTGPRQLVERGDISLRMQHAGSPKGAWIRVTEVPLVAFQASKTVGRPDPTSKRPMSLEGPPGNGMPPCRNRKAI